MHLGDCLEVMKSIPAGSVDLVLCDPPYGTIKGIGDNACINHGMKGKASWDFAIAPTLIFEECNRILRTNGALILFCQEPYTSRLITEAHANLPFSYRLVWIKDHFANSLLAKKAPVSYFEDLVVFFKKYDTLMQHPLRDYAKKIMEYIGRNIKQINTDLGHRRAEHFFYVESTQFGLCTENTYNQIIDHYGLSACDWLMPYAEMFEIDRMFARRFNLTDGAKYKSNVLQYKKDYTGLHPTQKPVALLADIIRTYSNPGETVLDFTMGSGSTGVACINEGRNFIGIELDETYFQAAQGRIMEAAAVNEASAAAK